MRTAGLFLAFAVTLAAQIQGPLTDQRVYQLVSSGLDPSEVIRLIGSASEVNFDLSPAATDALAKAGVSEEIIKAMAARQTIRATTPVSNRTTLKSVVQQAPIVSKPRIFILHSNDSYSGSSTHPQTVELMKTFGQSCPTAIVTNERANADYVVQFERESLKGIRKHNKFAAFNRQGDMVYSSSTRALGSAVRGFCSSIQVR